MPDAVGAADPVAVGMTDADGGAVGVPETELPDGAGVDAPGV